MNNQTTQEKTEDNNKAQQTANTESNQDESREQPAARADKRNDSEDKEPAASDEESELSLSEALDKLAAAKAEARQAQEDLLRVQADMQNLRRRTEQDVEKAHKFALERFSSELLTVMDNLERAREASRAHDDPTVKAIHEGVELTLKSFTDVLQKFHIETLDPHGEPFDPQLHQAMATQENGVVEPDTVLNVMQKGYTLNGRVLRPAMVVVSKVPAGTQNNQKNEGNQ